MKMINKIAACAALLSILLTAVSCADPETGIDNEVETGRVEETEKTQVFDLKSAAAGMPDPSADPKVTLDEVRDIIDMAAELYAQNAEIKISDEVTVKTNAGVMDMTAEDVRKNGINSDEVAEFRKMVGDVNDIIVGLFLLRFPDNAGYITSPEDQEGHGMILPKATFVLDINGTGCSTAGHAMNKYHEEHADIGGYIRFKSWSVYYIDTATGDIEYLYPTQEMNAVIDEIERAQD